MDQSAQNALHNIALSISNASRNKLKADFIYLQSVIGDTTNLFPTGVSVPASVSKSAEANASKQGLHWGLRELLVHNKATGLQEVLTFNDFSARFGYTFKEISKLLRDNHGEFTFTKRSPILTKEERLNFRNWTKEERQAHQDQTYAVTRIL